MKARATTGAKGLVQVLVVAFCEVGRAVPVAPLANRGEGALPPSLSTFEFGESVDSFPHKRSDPDAALGGQPLQSAELVVGELNLGADDISMLALDT